MQCSAVLTAPTPTYTAYEVPTGGNFVATPNSATLSTMAAIVDTLGHGRVKTSVCFGPMAAAALARAERTMVTTS